MSWTVTIGTVTVGDGTPWYWTEEAPELFGFSELRVDDAATPGRWGEVTVGPDLPGARTIQFRVSTSTVDAEADALTELEALAAAWRISETDVPIELVTPLRTFHLTGRVRRFQPDLTDVHHGVLTVAIQLRCADPRFYGPVELAGSDMSESSGGLGFPFGFPFGFGSVTPGEVVLVNEGNAPAGLLAVVSATSAVVSPEWVLVETGEVLSLPGLTIPEGWFLTVDWAARTARMAASNVAGAPYLDVGNYVDRVVSDWWTRSGDLLAGTNTVQFSGASGNGSVGYLFRSAWMF